MKYVTKIFVRKIYVRSKFSCVRSSLGLGAVHKARHAIFDQF